MRIAVTCTGAFLLVAVSSYGQIVVPGADGSDGPLVVFENTEIDLSLAVPRMWNEVSPDPPNGVYDPAMWAVVFKYSSVDIRPGVTLTFKNHPSRAPVVWLVSGNVVIDGTIDLNGNNGSGPLGTYAEPGPGGFRGGARALDAAPGSGGFGPGGGPSVCNKGASYGTHGTANECDTNPSPTYGNLRLIPLIGGSGGSSYEGYHGYNWGSGGGGGGAILIACEQNIALSGGIRADGGNGGGRYDRYGGSGGGIRLVADTIDGPGSLRAVAGAYAGAGRIRVEANDTNLSDPGSPPYTLGFPEDTAVLWPSDLPLSPATRLVSIGGQVLPTDLRASLDFPRADLTVTDLGPIPVVVETQNVPLDASWGLEVRIVAKQGPDKVISALFQSGDETLATWRAMVTMSGGFSAIQARAYKLDYAAREAAGLDTTDDE